MGSKAGRSSDPSDVPPSSLEDARDAREAAEDLFLGLRARPPSSLEDALTNPGKRSAASLFFAAFFGADDGAPTGADGGGDTFLTQKSAGTDETAGTAALGAGAEAALEPFFFLDILPSSSELNMTGRTSSSDELPGLRAFLGISRVHSYVGTVLFAPPMLKTHVHETK
jgi:hypothetical protein